MNYLIASLAALLSAALTYIIFNNELVQKIKVLRPLDNQYDYEKKSISICTSWLLTAFTFLLSLFALIIVSINTSDRLSIIKMSLAMICIVGSAANDYKEHRIPNIFPLVMALGGIVCLAIGFIIQQNGATAYIVSSLIATIGVALCLALASILTKHGIGLGDIKLLCSLGLIGGVYTICGTLFFGMTACALTAVVLLLTKKKTLKGSVPFGPFIFVGYLISIFCSIY